MADAAAREARRQRILKSGADRLAKISGVTAPSGAAAAVEDAPASVAAADQTEQAALAPSPITPVDIQAAILATAPLVAAEHFKQQQPQPPRIRRGTSSMSTSAALEENGLGGSTGSGGGGVQDTIVMTVLNTIAPERTAAKPSALAVATTGLPAWFTASQVLLVVALVLAQFGSVWQSLGDEPSVFKWIATFEHLLSGPTSLEFGLPMLPLLLAGQLMLYTLLRLIGPVHSGTTQAVLRSLPGNIALLLALVFLVPGALTLL